MRSFALAAALALGLALPATQAGAVEGKLVLYTSQPNTDAQQTIDAFKANTPRSRSASCATERRGSWPSSGPSSKPERRRPTCC